ncbi:hypothetical protein C8R41DRAFT_869761 [Lentinula lateritia]|uniref:Uncharacterized protein n=1 Tax=Lentinula lateritia TaxID=40482 RepID=A0ABQ8V806_9AGAR|nr:hypothetical protein C8R41DRAFT_869761 [Lentinula lateritia]
MNIEFRMDVFISRSYLMKNQGKIDDFERRKWAALCLSPCVGVQPVGVTLSGALYSIHFLDLEPLSVKHSLWNSFSSSITKHSRECPTQPCFLNEMWDLRIWLFFGITGYESRPFPVNLTIYPDKVTTLSGLTKYFIQAEIGQRITVPIEKSKSFEHK